MTRYKEHTTVEITINEKDKKHIGEEMKRFLADTYILYVMTQNFHWNVTGPLFHSLHSLFEKQYVELAEAADLIAERIRALGLFAPGTLRDFTELSSLHEDTQIPEAEEMIQRLIEGHLFAAQKDRFNPQSHH